MRNQVIINTEKLMEVYPVDEAGKVELTKAESHVLFGAYAKAHHVVDANQKAYEIKVKVRNLNDSLKNTSDHLDIIEIFDEFKAIEAAMDKLDSILEIEKTSTVGKIDLSAKTEASIQEAELH